MPNDLYSVWLLGKRLCPLAVLIAVSLLGVERSALAREYALGKQEEPHPTASAGDAKDPVVTYAADFFDKYQPNTALDMVRQVPGFRLDDGDDQRGLGGAGGNLLINDRYVSAKQDTPSTILARIPASRVARIELVRGQVRDIDLRGRSAVVNLILAEDDNAATRWELSLRKNFAISQLTPSGSISIVDRWRNTDYSVGADARRASFGDPGTEDVLDGSGNLVEQRNRDHIGRGYTVNGHFNASRWVGETLLQFNTSLGLNVRTEKLDTQREPLTPGAAPSDDFFVDKRDDKQFEFGLDAERKLNPNLLAKAILLFFQLDKTPSSSQRSVDAAGNETLFRKADTDAETTESIARLEFDWTAIPNHIVKINLEVARNVLDNSLEQIVDVGNGPEITVVPGANTRVKEVRGDIQLSDTWSFGNSELIYEIGAEISTISQSGDTDLERDFFFLKPQVTFTHTASSQRQTRLRVAREVSQLDFDDFVSATVFEDDDLALGNPDLQPETTWVAELSEERRFGPLGVVKVTAFHHWISDVEDLLPLTPDFEAPGNIGDGRRWGVLLDTTLPLEAIGLAGARLDIKARWQDSVVEDPVTGQNRVLSSEGGQRGDVLFLNENKYALFVEFRQDFDAARIAWGWNVAMRAERPLFKVNELDVFDEGTELNTFIETTRWLGLKIRLSGINLLDMQETRDRTVYVAERDLSPVSFRELRKLTNGARVLLSFSGAF